MSEDPAEIVYQMAAEKARFQAAQYHVNEGLQDPRSKGSLGEALLEFQKAYAINPGSSVAQQELTRTQEMILRERKRVAETGKEAAAEAARPDPGREVKKQTQGEDRAHPARARAEAAESGADPEPDDQ